MLAAGSAEKCASRSFLSSLFSPKPAVKTLGGQRSDLHARTDPEGKKPDASVACTLLREAFARIESHSKSLRLIQESYAECFDSLKLKGEPEKHLEIHGLRLIRSFLRCLYRFLLMPRSHLHSNVAATAEERIRLSALLQAVLASARRAQSYHRQVTELLSAYGVVVDAATQLTLRIEERLIASESSEPRKV